MAPRRTDRILVRFKTSTTAATVESSLIAVSGASVLKRLRAVKGLALVKVPNGDVEAAAAGNGLIGVGFDIDSTPMYPAGCDLPNVISVAAVDGEYREADFMNFGRFSVDLAAPGVNIYSTDLDEIYGFRDGTSMAAPHVTGVVALLWSRRPELS